MEIRAEMAANVWQIRCEIGQSVHEGDELIILESMKMEVPVVSPTGGIVRQILVKPDDVVQPGDLLAVVD